MSDSLTVAANSVVHIHYTLTLDSGEVVDSSSGREPLAYLHGHNNIVPGLEEQLTGKSVGDKLKAVVSPDKGYGEHNPEGVQTAPRSAFPAEVDIQPGMQFQAQSPDGSPAMLTVTAINGDDVTIDLNHPLAGKTLNFDIEITEIRAATEEELQHGHIHGPGGQDH